MPIDNDCPKDSERVIDDAIANLEDAKLFRKEQEPGRWKDAQDVVNLTIAADDTLDVLRRMTLDHIDGCSCNPCRVRLRLARDLKAME